MSNSLKTKRATRLEHTENKKGFLSTYEKYPDFICSAPGRIELLGNHVDYNGGSVMGIGINRYVTTGIGATSDESIQIFSEFADSRISSSIHKIERQQGDKTWGNYILGVLDEIIKLGISPSHGFKMYISSKVPSGKGLSSSAALEVSVAHAILSLYEIALEDSEIFKLCKRAENNFVGVPCGVLDHATSACSKENHVILIDCENEEVTRNAFSEKVVFWIFDSSTEHYLVDSLYSERFLECQDASKLLDQNLRRGRLLAKYTKDDLSTIRSKFSSNIFKRASHVIEENDRVYQANFDLHNSDIKRFGQRLFESHKSSQYQFENSCLELDFLVQRLALDSNVYGARLTGGGFGGAVIAMTNLYFEPSDADGILEAFKKNFSKESSALQVSTDACCLIEALS